MHPLLAIAFVFLVFLSPCFKVAEGLPTLRAEDAVIVAFLVGLCIAPGRYLRKPPAGESDRVTIVILIMGGMAFVSLIFSALRNPIILNDFMIFPMLFRYWLIFKLGQSLVEPRARLYCLFALVVAVGISASVGILQFHNFGAISYWLNKRYEWGAAQAMDLEELLAAAGSRRVGGTHGDPRYFGCLLVVGLGACTSLWLYLRQGTVRLLVICVAPLCLAALVYTASRTPLLSLVIIVMLALLIHHRARGIDRTKIVSWLLLAALGVGILSISMTTAFKERVFRTDTDSYQYSANARKRDFLRPFTAALHDPALFIVGRGPSKAVMRSCGHSDIGWHFARFGLVGLAAYLFLITLGLKGAYQGLKSARTPAEESLRMTALLAMVVWAVFMLAESIFKDTQIMALNMFILGLISPAAVSRAVTSPARRRFVPARPSAFARPGRPWPRPQNPFALRRASRITGPRVRRANH